MCAPPGEAALRHFAQHRVDDAGDALTHRLSGELDRRAHGRVRSHFHAQQLVGAQPKQIDHGRLQRAQRAPRGGFNHQVVGAHQTTGAGDQLCDEARVAAVEIRCDQAFGEGEVGVGVLSRHLAKDVEGHPARVGARRVHANTSGLAPRAQSNARIRRFPGACTSISSSAPEPVPTTIERFSIRTCPGFNASSRVARAAS